MVLTFPSCKSAL